jgi:hypothetical protein
MKKRGHESNPEKNTLMKNEKEAVIKPLIK